MIRLALTSVATAAIAYAAWANTASTFYGKFSAEQGPQFIAPSARGLINTTEKAEAQKDNKTFLKIARLNSIRALESEPLSPNAVRQLGVYFTATGNSTKGRELVLLSAELSRRDAIGQLWLAQDNLSNRKPNAGLRALDVVIRTQPEAHEPAFRLLGASLANSEFRDIFVAYTVNRPPWLRKFIEYNVSNLKQPQLLAQTLARMEPLPNSVLTEESAGLLLALLVNRAPIAESRDFYLRLPGASQKNLTTIDFARPADTFRFAPIGWDLSNTPDVQGFGNLEGKTLSIEALAMPNRHGTAARKLLFLRPGAYRWSVNADLSGMHGKATGAMRLRCNHAAGAWSVATQKDFTSGPNKLEFTVGSDCSAQMLTIDVTGAENQSDASMIISKMTLVPLSTALGVVSQQSLPVAVR